LPPQSEGEAEVQVVEVEKAAEVEAEEKEVVVEAEEEEVVVEEEEEEVVVEVESEDYEVQHLLGSVASLERALEDAAAREAILRAQNRAMAARLAELERAAAVGGA